MPFLIIICVGVILVLLLSLWRAFFSESSSGKAAYMHILEGSAQMNTWGTDKYFDLSSDALIIEGDSIRSSSNAKIIVEFFDGTIMRLDGDSDVKFESIDTDAPSIKVILNDGRIWINKLYKNTQDTDLIVVMNDSEVNASEASIFAVENQQSEVLRVFDVFDKNGALINILSKDSAKVVESESVGVGQQVVLTAAALDKFLQHLSPNVVTAISEDFKVGGWYEWNLKEDSEPTEFEKTVGPSGVGLVKVEPETVIELEPVVEVEEVEEVEEEPVEADETVEAVVELGGLGAPIFGSVSGANQANADGFYKVTGSVATIKGGISGASKVVVNGFTLKKFNAGDSDWTYFANSDFGLMKEGENTYEVYGLDANGKRGESLFVKVLYEPPKPEVKVEVIDVEVIDVEE